MSFLDVFALFILFVLAAAAVAVWIILGMLPGRIARSENTRRRTPSPFVGGGARSPLAC